MKIRSRAAAAITAAVALTVSLVAAGSASAAPGDTPETPIVLTSLADLPAGAVATGSSVNACATTTTYSATTPAVIETTRTEYRYSRVVPAVTEIREYTFDKFVQRQKARWVGTRYDNAISLNYPGSYSWRDAGFDPVVNTTGATPTAPGPVRGEFIHNSNGTWYFTLFYEYRKISERIVRAAQPAFTEYYVAGGTPTRDRAAASWITATSFTGWTRFEQRTVGNGDAQPAVVTYYAYSDGKVCTTTTPTPEPPVTVPPPIPARNPQVNIATRCTGTTKFTLDNRKSAERVAFTMLAKKNGRVVWSKAVSVPGGEDRLFVKRLPNGAKAIVRTLGDRAQVRIPNPCPTPPVTPPNTGAKTVR